jgi:hypothetical protein
MLSRGHDRAVIDWILTGGRHQDKERPEVVMYKSRCVACGEDERELSGQRAF